MEAPKIFSLTPREPIKPIQCTGSVESMSAKQIEYMRECFLARVELQKISPSTNPKAYEGFIKQLSHLSSAELYSILTEEKHNFRHNTPYFKAMVRLLEMHCITNAEPNEFLQCAEDDATEDEPPVILPFKKE